MFASTEYELLDFGAGRKLERFGPIVLDRPAPAAEESVLSRPSIWAQAHARFELTNVPRSNTSRGKWTLLQDVPSTWQISHGNIHFELKLTEFGHVGVFPEQAANWDWITKTCGCARHPHPSPRLEGEGERVLHVLNLFAYTGGSTFAAAAAGTAVTHVDAAQNIVSWARRNAEVSSLSAAQIRWIVEDTLKFARRELKRGRHYDGVILDPPSYGHGPGGEVWKLDDQLTELLSVCRELTLPKPEFALLTCHAPYFDLQRLAQCFVTTRFAPRMTDIDCGDLWLTTADGQRLHSGVFARCVGR